jgi:hypothetical protein
MKGLKTWLLMVGGFYILLGIGFFPPINEARLPFMLPIDVLPETVAYKAVIDWTFTFGLDLLVIGGYLVYASREPLKHINLVWLVIWLEAIRGVANDIYYIFRGYASVPFYIGFIVVHVIIIATGLRVARQGRAVAAQTRSQVGG